MFVSSYTFNDFFSNIFFNFLNTRHVNFITPTIQKIHFVLYKMYQGVGVGDDATLIVVEKEFSMLISILP